MPFGVSEKQTNDIFDWIRRMWLKTRRGEVPEDPVVFALKDRTSYIAGVFAALVLYAATV